MIKVKDTKLSADIDDEVVELVTFWGNIKGDIKKQKDLLDLVDKDIKLLKADVMDEFQRVSERILEVKYDDDVLGVDEINANKDHMVFVASNPASGNSQEIELLRKEAIEHYVQEKVDDLADYVYEYMLSKGFVSDTDYNHTDNNFTSEARDKVATIDSVRENANLGIQLATEAKDDADAAQQDINNVKGKVVELNTALGELDAKAATKEELDQGLQEVLEYIPILTSELVNDGDGIAQDSEGNNFKYVTEDVVDFIEGRVVKLENGVHDLIKIVVPSPELEDGEYVLKYFKHGSEDWIDWVEV